MDPVSCLYNFLSIGILCYFVIICFLVKKCCMNCGTKCTEDNLCKCYQKIYEGEITPSNHVIVREGEEKLPISYLLDQQTDNEGEYVIGNDGILYRNEACKECCAGDDVSRSSCNSHEDVFVIRTTTQEECTPCSPSALGLGEGSIKRTASGHSVPTSLAKGKQGFTGGASYMSAGQYSGVISQGGDSMLGAGHQPITKEPSQVVDFQAGTSEHIFTVEGTVSTPEVSRNIHGSASSCGSKGSASCGSRTSDSQKSSVSPSELSEKSSSVLSSIASGAAPLAEEDTSVQKASSPSGGSCSSLGKPSPDAGGADSPGGGAQKVGSKTVSISEANVSPSESIATSRKPFGADLPAEESPSSSIKGILKSPPDPAKEVKQRPKSDSCISPCGSPAGSRSNKSNLSSAKSLPPGSLGGSYAQKDSSKSSAGSTSSPSRGGKNGRGGSASSDKNKTVCTGSLGGASLKKDISSTAMSQHSQSETISSFSPGIITPRSSPSSPDQKSGFRSGGDDLWSNESKTGNGNKNGVGRTHSPILKNITDSTPGREGVTSPRVSIKEHFDIITPEGIRSAPTFGKDSLPEGSGGTQSASTIDKEGCEPCKESDSTSAEEGSLNSRRRNDVLSDEYKDKTSNKRKPDKYLAGDTSRGPKSARLSDHCDSVSCSSKAGTSKSCSKCSTRGSSSFPSKSEISSTPMTNLSSTKYSNKVSSGISDTQISSLASTKPSGTNSLCDITCKPSKSANSSSKNYKTASVTTADIDDFRPISPGRSRCENLGSALARSSCGEIRKIREESTCEAIKDPSKFVTCNHDNTDPNSECTAIRELLAKSKCAALLELVDTIDNLGGIEGRQSGGTSAAISGSTFDNQDVADSSFAQGASTTIDAAVIHEISTKVQSCLQHARSIAAKMGSSTECRKTMRVQAKNLGPESRDQAQSVKVNSNMMLHTRGIAINEYNRVDKPLGKDPGIQVKLVNANGNVQQFKKPYKDLMTSDPNHEINIRIRSPCKSTPGKLLCVSTTNNPCCSDTATYNTTSSTYTQPSSSTQGPSSSQQEPSSSAQDPSQRRLNYADEVTSGEEFQSDSNMDGGHPSSQDYSSQDTTSPGAVALYQRPAKETAASPRTRINKGECSPGCQSCKKKTCPGSNYYKGGRKKPGKLQIYNMTTSHFSQIKNYRTPYIKGLPIIDPRMYDAYIHPERYRGGENYLKRRRDMMHKIKDKCPWM